MMETKIDAIERCIQSNSQELEGFCYPIPTQLARCAQSQLTALLSDNQRLKGRIQESQITNDNLVNQNRDLNSCLLKLEAENKGLKKALRYLLFNQQNKWQEEIVRKFHKFIVEPKAKCPECKYATDGKRTELSAYCHDCCLETFNNFTPTSPAPECSECDNHQTEDDDRYIVCQDGWERGDKNCLKYHASKK